MAGSRDSRGFRDYPRRRQKNHYRVNEHFDTQWNPLPDYKKITRRIASARLEVHQATGSMGPFNAAHPCCPGSPLRTTTAWLLEDAKGLFNATVRDAWAPMARTGLFIPLTGKENRWSGTCTLAYRRSNGYGLRALHRTGDRQYETWYQTWWEYCIKY